MHQIPPKSSLSFFAPHLATQTEGTIRVRAKFKGFYDNTLRNPGDGIRPADEFAIRSMDELADWMELVTDDAPAEAPDARESKPAKGKSGGGKKDEKGEKSENDVL